jgi:hypothetical protein
VGQLHVVVFYETTRTCVVGHLLTIYVFLLL